MSRSHDRRADYSVNPFKRTRIGESDRQAHDENLRNKLYVGNMDARLTEAAFLKLMQPFGRIANIEYRWHEFGPDRGKPRGFAFCEYEEREVGGLLWRRCPLPALPTIAQLVFAHD